MRYVSVPRAAVLKSRAVAGQDPPTYSFHDFLRNQVLADKRWYSNLDWEEALGEMEKLQEAKVGDVVELTDKAHEKLEEVVRSVDIAGDIKVQMRWIVRAITQADKIDPRPKQAEQKAAEA